MIMNNPERWMTLTIGLFILISMINVKYIVVGEDSATATSTIGINCGNMTEVPKKISGNVTNQMEILQLSNDTIVENIQNQEVLAQDDYWTESIFASVTFLLALILTRKILIIKYPDLDYKN